MPTPALLGTLVVNFTVANNGTCRWEGDTSNGREYSSWGEQQVATGAVGLPISQAFYNQIQAFYATFLAAQVTRLGLTTGGGDMKVFFRFVAIDKAAAPLYTNVDVIIEKQMIGGREMPVDPAYATTLIALAKERGYGILFTSGQILDLP